MQELDGARLQIVEVSESGEYRAAGDSQRDDDADSLSDLAVRLQDDPLRPQDAQVNTFYLTYTSFVGFWGSSKNLSRSGWIGRENQSLTD